MSQQITTISIFTSDDLAGHAKGFIAVAEGWLTLPRIKGQTFHKVMGVGKPGFDPRPDWSKYMHVQVWENEKFAVDYFQNHPFHAKLKRRAVKFQQVFLKNLKARGQWAGKNPFKESTQLDDQNDFIFVLTRARIKLLFLKRFWDYVPKSQQGLDENPDLLYKIGVGEWPVTHMATLSLWKNSNALKKFAYRGKEHRGAIQQTQALQWYSEEMFSRFQPYRIVGDFDEFEVPGILREN